MAVDKYTEERWARPAPEPIRAAEDLEGDFEPGPLFERSILELAQERVETKPTDYGPPAANAERIAALWNIYLDARAQRTSAPLGGDDVAILMVLLKVAREANRAKRDNLVDIAGWAAVADAAREGS